MDAVAILNRILALMSFLSVNPKSFKCETLTCERANYPYQFPSVKVPFNMSVVVTALDTNANPVYITNSKNATPQISYRLLAGRSVSIKVKDVSEIWGWSQVALDSFNWIVEVN